MEAEIEIENKKTPNGWSHHTGFIRVPVSLEHRPGVTLSGLNPSSATEISVTSSKLFKLVLGLSFLILKMQIITESAL